MQGASSESLKGEWLSLPIGNIDIYKLFLHLLLDKFLFLK